MTQADASTRSYRCSFFPKDAHGVTQPSDSGALPSIRLQARNGTEAELLANAAVNGVVAHVERIDDDQAAISFEPANDEVSA